MDTHVQAAGRTAGDGLTLQHAIEEAHRCLLCHDAPCSAACPGGTDPARFIRQIRFLNLKGAARTVLRNNPLGGVCAHVCPTEDTCTGACLRSGIDRPIDIAALQRFAVEHGRRLGVRPLQRAAELPQRVAVIGSGPAGLTVAAQLAQRGYGVTVFEARGAAGGMLRYGVPKSRLDDRALDADLGDILRLGVELKTNTRIDGPDGAAALLRQGFAAVFVAPGLWRPYALSMPGSDLDGVTTALDFLALSRTAPEKAGGLVRDRNVVIVGGGSVAMDVAHTARSLGARRIYAVALESMTELPAKRHELDGALYDGVIIKPQCQLTRIVGDGGKVTGVEGTETEWIEPGKLVPSNARRVEGTAFSLRAGAVIQAIGQGPTDEVGSILTGAERKGPYLRADEKTRATTIARVFAGGDVVRGPATVVEAVADGKKAADAICKLLSEVSR